MQQPPEKAPLAAGMYRLEVAMQFSKNAILKEPRTASFDRVLTVV